MEFAHLCMSIFLFFFFQAEDGIRDTSVTGVQTCALPIWDGVVGFLVEATRLGERGLGVSLARFQDRKSVVKGKSVDLGGRRVMKKKRKEEVTMTDSRWREQGYSAHWMYGCAKRSKSRRME